MNCVTLVGNLASDVEMKELAEERKLASFLLAVDRESSDGGADFVRITVWNRQAETCAQFLSRGQQVAIDGRLRSRSWQDSEGKRRSAVEVVADRVQFLSRPQRSDASGAAKEAVPAA